MGPSQTKKRNKYAVPIKSRRVPDALRYPHHEHWLSVDCNPECVFVSLSVSVTCSPVSMWASVSHSVLLHCKLLPPSVYIHSGSSSPPSQQPCTQLLVLFDDRKISLPDMEDTVTRIRLLACELSSQWVSNFLWRAGVRGCEDSFILLCERSSGRWPPLGVSHTHTGPLRGKHTAMFKHDPVL